MSFIVISCHSYHVVYTQFRRHNITSNAFNIAFHHMHYHIRTYCITIYHIINKSIYRISRIITYFISYDNIYIFLSFTCCILIISYYKHFVVMSFLTYHSLNVLLPITVMLLHERTLVISSQDRILTCSINLSQTYYFLPIT